MESACFPPYLFNILPLPSSKIPFKCLLYSGISCTFAVRKIKKEELDMNTKAKKLFIVTLLTLVTAMFHACGNNGKVTVTEDEAEIKFDTVSHDFGVIPKDTTVRFEYQFSNVGATPLRLHTVVASCGCVGVTYPHGSIEPGEKGIVTATYDTHDRRSGRFSKSINIYSNAKTDYVRLTVSGKVSK